MDLLKKRWVEYRKNFNKIGFKKKGNKIILENASDSIGFIIIPKLFLFDTQFIKLQFAGKVLEGNSALLYLLEPTLNIISESSLNSETLVWKNNFKKYMVAVKILPFSKVEINTIELSKCESENDYCIEDLNNDTLIITPSYPSEENRYLCGFVHARVKAYKKAGLKFDLICAHGYQNAMKYKFEDVDVLKTSFDNLRKILIKKKYKQILVHFFDDKYSNVFNACDLTDTKLYLWVHGPETLYWDWPKFTTQYFTQLPKLNDGQKDIFYKYDNMIKSYNDNPNVTWIFVSEWIKNQSERLINIKFNKYKVIPNYIDENNFNYIEKNVEQRKKIFFLRRFDNINKYAIDINIKTILELSRREFFNELEFNIYGTGDFYDTLIGPIKDFENVHLHRKFFTQKEIADIHKDNGVALFATRYDAQGVSMCEAAMSGLVIVGSKNEAIEEFIPNDIGLLAETEDYVQYADIIEKLYKDSSYFNKSSLACCMKVNDICSFEKTIQKEIELFENHLDNTSTTTKISQDNNIILTVVIPAYNVSDYIQHTIKSLINQKYAKNLEIIVVNDGSKDDTSNLVKEIIQSYTVDTKPIIKLIDKQNGGHGSTINVGIQEARGKYIRIIDGDDWVNTEDFEKLLEKLDTEEVDIVVSDYSEYIADLNIIILKKWYESMQPYKKYNFDDMCYEGYGFSEWGPILATANFKTKMLQEYSFKLSEKSFYVDMEFDVFSIIGAKSIKYYTLDIYRYFIGRTGQSISKESYERNYLQHEKVLFNIIDFVFNGGKLSKQKKEYATNKIIIPMIRSQYLIVGQFISSKMAFNEFDKKLKKYQRLYNNSIISTRFIRFHRRTHGFLLFANPVLIKTAEMLKKILRRI